MSVLLDIALPVSRVPSISCVSEPEAFIAAAMPLLEELASPGGYTAAPRRGLETLAIERADITDLDLGLAYASMSLRSPSRQCSDGAASVSARARVLVTQARARWFRDVRSSWARAELLERKFGVAVSPREVESASWVLWVVCGRSVSTGPSDLFIEAFSVERWLSRDLPSVYVTLVPEWVPGCPPRALVFEPSLWSAIARFPSSIVFGGVSETVADTFAALWEPLNPESVFAAPASALAAARGLAH